MAPQLGRSSITPMAASSCRASRIGVRLTWKSAASRSSRSRSPGFQVPPKMFRSIRRTRSGLKIGSAVEADLPAGVAMVGCEIKAGWDWKFSANVIGRRKVVYKNNFAYNPVCPT